MADPTRFRRFYGTIRRRQLLRSVILDADNRQLSPFTDRSISRRSSTTPTRSLTTPSGHRRPCAGMPTNRSSCTWRTLRLIGRCTPCGYRHYGGGTTSVTQPFEVAVRESHAAGRDRWQAADVARSGRLVASGRQTLGSRRHGVHRRCRSHGPGHPARSCANSNTGRVDNMFFYCRTTAAAKTKAADLRRTIRTSCDRPGRH